MRIESSVTSLSWIPQGATEGFNRLTFRLPGSPTRSATSQGAGGPGRAGGPRRAASNRPLPAGQPAQGLDRGAGRTRRGRRPGRLRPHRLTKVGYGPASIAFTPVALPDLRPSATG